jgi:predicted deacetylase
LKAEFNDLKVTLFIPTAYTRYKEESYYISHHKWFLDLINGLDLSTYELGWHGHYHGVLHESSNDEFKKGVKKNFLNTFKLMEDEMLRSGLLEKVSPVFRPPAFWMNPDAFEAAREFGIEVLALSPLEHHKACYQRRDERWAKKSYFTSLPDYEPLRFEDKMDIVYHAYETDQNYLDDRKTEELIMFLDKHREKISFRKFTE